MSGVHQWVGLWLLVGALYVGPQHRAVDPVLYALAGRVAARTPVRGRVAPLAVAVVLAMVGWPVTMADRWWRR